MFLPKRPFPFTTVLEEIGGKVTRKVREFFASAFEIAADHLDVMDMKIWTGDRGVPVPEAKPGGSRKKAVQQRFSSRRLAAKAKAGAQKARRQRDVGRGEQESQNSQG